MEKNFAKIINEGKKQGAPVEAINAELKAAGANFYLDPNGRISGWTEQEMKAGFILAGEESAYVRHLHDYMRYDVRNAGQTVRVETPEGTYDITWDEDGHPEKAVRV